MAQVNIAHIASLEILSHSANKIFISITKTCPSFKILSEKNDILNIFAQNIDCGYTLEPPRRGSSNGYPQSVLD